MKVLIFLVCMSGICSSVLGQDPKPCEAPKLWEGDLFEVDPEKEFVRHARISYDAVMERIAIVERETEGPTHEIYKEIALYKDETFYRINLRTRECTKSPLTKKFRPFEVPSNATYYGTFTIGLVDTGEFGGIKIYSFGGDTENGRYVGTWTTIGCAPVTDVFFDKETGLVHSSFYDIVAGISDPDVFIPPEDCK